MLGLAAEMLRWITQLPVYAWEPKNGYLQCLIPRKNGDEVLIDRHLDIHVGKMVLPIKWTTEQEQQLENYRDKVLKHAESAKNTLESPLLVDLLKKHDA